MPKIKGRLYIEAREAHRHALEAMENEMTAMSEARSEANSQIAPNRARRSGYASLHYFLDLGVVSLVTLESMLTLCTYILSLDGTASPTDNTSCAKIACDRYCLRCQKLCRCIGYIGVRRDLMSVFCSKLVSIK